jgi:signal peptide peptidase SppA
MIFNKQKTIISIDLKGMIASGGRAPLNIDNLNSLFSKISKLKFDALSINVNSPGGSPVQSSLIGQKIREISVKKKCKVYCFIEDVAASGGYWLACSADEIYADTNSIVGSIGVISGGFGFTDLIKKVGVERRIFTAGENKSFLDPFLKVNKKDLDKLKSLQTQIHQNFIDWVKLRRSKKLDVKNFKDVFSGSFWLSNEAKNLGLIDGIDNENNFFKKKFGEKTKIKKIKQPKSLKQKLGLGLNSTIADDIFSKIKEELLFNRFGL